MKNVIAPYIDTITMNRVSKTNRSLIAHLWHDVIGVAPVDLLKRGAVVSIYDDDDEIPMRIAEFQYMPSIGLFRLTNIINQTTYYHPSFIQMCIVENKSKGGNDE